MDGAYKGRLHVAWPFIGRKTLTERRKEYNDVHGHWWEHVPAHVWTAPTQEDNDDED